MNFLMKKQLDDSLLTCIQDINRELQLETKMVANRDDLKSLRNDRNSSCHYIEENKDSNNLKMHKIHALVEYIASMKPDVKQDLECMHGCDNLLDEIVKYYNNELKNNMVLNNLTDIEKRNMKCKLSMLININQ